MIIKREYEWLGVLYDNDPLSREAIDSAFTLVSMNEMQKEEIINANHCNIPAFLNLGCGIPGECYKSLMDQFDRLDKTNPYENGLSFKDVTKIEYETSRKGTAIQMRFVSMPFDAPYRVVGFAAVENNNGNLLINKGWEMTAPFVIG